MCSELMTNGKIPNRFDVVPNICFEVLLSKVV
jgi:hypothetical protein